MTFVPPETFNLADWLLDSRVAEGNGERVALVLPGETWTYRQLLSLADRFATVLSGLGLRSEERVLLILPDSAEFVGALFGVLKNGAVAVPVNPELKPEACAALLSYLEPRGIVLTREHAALWQRAQEIADCSPWCLVVGEEFGSWPSFEKLSREVQDRFSTARTHRDDPAIMLFSGGTTGRPKAVLQPHRSFAYTTVAYGQGVLELSNHDRTLSVPKLYFGYALGSNLFFPFSVGASTVLFADRPTPERVRELVLRHQPTVFITVPKFLQQLLQTSELTREDLRSLRLATSAGEALPPALLEQFRSRFAIELLDGLGTAEEWHIFLTNRPGRVWPGTLGEPVPGFEVRVRDSEGRDLPDGEVGYLWVRGGARALGYFRNRDKTEEVFRGPWVVPGDLVSREASGYFRYHGRADDAVKVAGKWFSPGEVEALLTSHPEVSECCVVVCPDEAGLNRPHAFVVARNASHSNLGELLRQYLQDQLQPYKIPRAFHFLPELPRTHLGKIDRGRLRALAIEPPARDA